MCSYPDALGVKKVNRNKWNLSLQWILLKFLKIFREKIIFGIFQTFVCSYFSFYVFLYVFLCVCVYIHKYININPPVCCSLKRDSESNAIFRLCTRKKITLRDFLCSEKWGNEVIRLVYDTSSSHDITFLLLNAGFFNIMKCVTSATRKMTCCYTAV